MPVHAVHAGDVGPNSSFLPNKTVESAAAKLVWDAAPWEWVEDSGVGADAEVAAPAPAGTGARVASTATLAQQETGGESVDAPAALQGGVHRVEGARSQDET